MWSYWRNVRAWQPGCWHSDARSSRTRRCRRVGVRRRGLASMGWRWVSWRSRETNASGSNLVTAWSVSGVPSVRVLPSSSTWMTTSASTFPPPPATTATNASARCWASGRARGRVSHHHLLVDHRAERAGLGGWQPGGDRDHAVGLGAPGQRPRLVLAGRDDVVVLVAVRPGGDRGAQPPGGGDRRELNERRDVVVAQVGHQDAGLGVGHVAVAHRGVQGRPLAQGAGDAHLGAGGAHLDLTHLGEPRRTRQRTPRGVRATGVELADQDQQLVGARRELAGQVDELRLEPLDRQRRHVAPVGVRRARGRADRPSNGTVPPAGSVLVSSSWDPPGLIELMCDQPNDGV